MRAVVHDRYGPADVLRFEEVERPVPKDDEVLVKIHATTVNRTDSALRAGEPFASRFITGLLRPKRKILGTELAGEVEAAGAAVSEFEVGDEVFGVNPWKFGTHAQFELRGGRGGLRRGDPGPGVPATGRSPEGKDDPRLWRVKPPGHASDGPSGKRSSRGL
jgi:NADPH:quinone reductase-like Zn-dependent oxidoreductase